MKIFPIIFLFIISLLICVPCQADINISVISRTHDYIYWHWDNNDSTSLSIDGRNITNFAINSSDYILSDLNPDETHIITIHNATEYGSNITKTLSSEEDTNRTKIYEILWLFVPFIIAWIFIFIGMIKRGLMFVGFGTIIFSYFTWDYWKALMTINYFFGIIYAASLAMSLIILAAFLRRR